MSCSPSGQQVALKMAGMCISCGAYRRAVTISLTAGQLVALIHGRSLNSHYLVVRLTILALKVIAQFISILSSRAGAAGTAGTVLAIPLFSRLGTVDCS